MKEQMTLSELSTILINKGFADIFDGDVESDCLNLEQMTGDWADREGEEIVYFDIIKVDKDSNHLNTIIEIDLSDLEKQTNYLIVDNTANTEKIYIGAGDENCALEENAIVYATEKEAHQIIIDNGWEEWAGVIGTDYPVNQ